MLRTQEGVFQTDVEVVEIDVVQEHVDATEVVGRRVHLLSVVLQVLVLLSYRFGELQQERTRTAGGVVNLLNARIVPRSQPGQEFRHLLRREELSATLACLASVHLHQELVGVAEGVVLGVVVARTEVHRADSLEDLCQQLVALDDG